MMALFAWAAALLALLPLAMAAGNLKRFVRPSRLPPVGTAVSILIPARNEAEGIAAAVNAALASTGVDIEVVVLDDDSIDRTGEIVSRLAAADRRVRIVAASPLARGWAGKQRACYLLSQAARHPVMMFIDADVRLAPDAAALAAGHLLARADLGLVSGFPREITVGPAERLVIPWIHLLLLGYLPMARMQRSASPAYGAACGQWIVTRADAYAAVRGHAAAPASRHDGTSLPRTFRAGGWHTDVFDGSRLAACRMYRDVGSVWHGFAKSAGEGMATRAALPVWTVLLAGGHILPWLLLPYGLAIGRPEIALAGGVGVGANLALQMLLRARLGQAWLGILLHPVGAAFVLVNQWSGLMRYLSGRPSEWRGRRYLRGDEDVGPAGDALR